MVDKPGHPPRPGQPAVTLELLRARLARQRPAQETPPGLSPAGVLVPVFVSDEVPHLLFTRRTQTVKDHRGQISFPGGVLDPGDPNLLATALRETREEIGLDPGAVEILGTLRPTTTITGYWISPVVGLIPHPYEFHPNPEEVAQLLTFPLQDFLPPERWRSGLYTYKGREISVCCWNSGEIVIWGATARVVLNLLTRLDQHPLGESPCVD